MRKLFCRLVWLLVLSAQALAADKLLTVLEARPQAGAGPAPVLYWVETRKEPRTLHISCLRADLSSKDIEAIALIPPKPVID